MIINYIKLLSLLLFQVFATTAANPKESSFACYFDKKIKAYLGDVYSVIWMEDSDAVFFLFQIIYFYKQNFLEGRLD